MKLHQLHIPLAVAQYGSIHEASCRLYISQPALSKTIAEPERGFGVTLLSHSVRDVNLTTCGMALVKQTNVIERELRRALENTEAVRGRVEAGLNISSAVVVSGNPLPDVTAIFRTRFPNVALHSFEQHSRQILEGLYEDRIDLGLIFTNNGPDTSGFRWEPLFSMPVCLAVCPGHSLRHTRKLRSSLDANRLVLDPLSDLDNPMASLMRLYRLEIPHRIVQSGSNLPGLQLATKTDLTSI